MSVSSLSRAVLPALRVTLTPDAHTSDRRAALAVSRELTPLSLSPTSPRHRPARRYKLDTTFVHLAAPEALSHLQAQLDKIRSEVDALEAEKDECAQQMDLLKKDLYAKFGSASHPLPCVGSSFESTGVRPWPWSARGRRCLAASGH